MQQTTTATSRALAPFYPVLQAPKANHFFTHTGNAFLTPIELRYTATKRDVKFQTPYAHDGFIIWLRTKCKHANWHKPQNKTEKGYWTVPASEAEAATALLLEWFEQPVVTPLI